jgi:hypothetical protein
LVSKGQTENGKGAAFDFRTEESESAGMRDIRIACAGIVVAKAPPACREIHRKKTDSDALCVFV